MSLLGVFGLGDHESEHEKALQWTIEGLQVDFPESFIIAVRENLHADFRVQVREQRGRKPQTRPLNVKSETIDFRILAENNRKTAKIVLSSIFQVYQRSRSNFLYYLRNWMSFPQETKF